MSSELIRNEISKSNKYWISKDKYLELKHFCLQYREWEQLYTGISFLKPYDYTFMAQNNRVQSTDFVEKTGNLLLDCSYKMDLVRNCCAEADPDLSNYIFKSVTEGVSYVYLDTYMRIPCCRNTFYDRYRRFFWLLSKER